MTRLFLGLPAPAKLNLFLHVLGRRADGYHELQSVFVPIGLADTLDLELRADGRIERTGDLIGEPERDLPLRAARLLQLESGCREGVSIHVDKRIPAGSGMGGGSSDAATVLIALNRLWRLNWPREKLARLAPRLGADVAFFLGPGPAFVEGAGERLTPVAVADAWYAVIHPGIAVATAEIFADRGLTRNTKPTIISAFSEAQSGFPQSFFGHNDLQPVAARRHPEVGQVLAHLGRFGEARVTGSGSAAFIASATQAHAAAAIAGLPASWQGWVVRGLREHPLAPW